jgi:prepilin-type processing-associated H-X9-DG protein
MDTGHQQATAWGPSDPNSPDPTVSYYTNSYNVSYFVAVDADESSLGLGAVSRVFLAGDRFMGNCTGPTYTVPPDHTTIYEITGYCQALDGGLHAAPVIKAGWATDIGHSLVGNVAMVDGSVQVFNNANLKNALKNTGDGVPGTVPGPHPLQGTMPGGYNRVQFQ